MIASLVVLGASSLLLPAPQSPTDPLAIITLACLAAFIASFAISWGPTVWVMLPEIFPLNVRGTGTGVSALSNWGANFIVAQAFLPLVALIGRSTVFWILAVICIAAALFIHFLVPETRGRSLEQIEDVLRDRVGTSS